MSLLSRLTDFEPNAIIASQPFDDEFNQLVNVFNGTSQNKSIQVRSNDSTFAVARFDQLSSNDIIELYSGGVEKCRIEQSGKFKSLVPTGTPPVDVDSITVCPNLNADLLDGLHASAFAQLATDVIAFTEKWFVADPSTFPVGGDDLGIFITPDGTNIFLNKIKVSFATGSHTGGGTLVFRLFLRTAASNWTSGGDVAGAEIQLNNTNNVIDRVYTATFAPVQLLPGDTVLMYLQARSGTISERNVSLGMSGTQGIT